MRRHLVWAALSAVAFGSSVSANVVGNDMNNFNPTVSGIDFVTVESAQTLEPGIINFGLYLNYAVNTLPHFDDLQTQSRVDLNDTLLFSDLNMGMGLSKNFEAGVSFPFLVRQTVTTAGYSGFFDRYGLTEIYITTKYRVWGDDDNGAALVASTNINTLQNDPFAGTGAGPTYNLQGAYNHRFGKIMGGMNLGYRIRQPGNPIPGIPISPFRNQYIASLGASYLIPDSQTKLISEIYGSYPVTQAQFQSDRSQSSLEILGGVKHDFTHQLAMDAGMGTQMISGSATPDWRVYVGLNYNIGPLYGKESIVEVTTGRDVLDQTPRSGQERFRGMDILFEFDSDRVRRSSLAPLQRLAEYLMKTPKFKHLLIEGHTDSVGSVSYNMDLSLRRAKSVKQILIDNFKLPEDRIDFAGYGPQRPVADNGNYQGRQRNRRVEFLVDR